ncbi:MAG: hypothetical protein JW779_04820 [Candidatus Thorarchaeota archaeon]|nr:hypothetical protein [Candidatus Thorarchaeota archaeon]
MQILDLLTDPLVLIIIAWIVAVVAAGVWIRRPKTKVVKVKGPLMKPIGKMIVDIERGKDLTPPPTKPRQEIITELFTSKMNAIGLEPSLDSGYIPVSHTPLARFLKDRGVADDTVSAIIAGLMEEDTEEAVREIIDATAESPEVNLVGSELEKAKQLAVDEWRNMRGQ